ncbi:hypothetical protein JIG36_24585 [Actinoplanes sp. LDG1-06]|uniref:Uncharacterized protein n=1 Tax=Paractinoplanes ovalisporus TaxID=2810368 RepID=A0ABS2AG32_9ACTN|nr:hypothetical protein [Actinoplanes ovalisporus]MBM2618740.1 hypothetical protein [Actinoplanes ovalisporus]
MRTGRRIGIVAATAAAVMGLLAVASPASAAPATDAQASAPKQFKGPRVVNQTLATVDANDSQWVRVKWKTDRRVCDAQVVIWANDDVQIDYPSDRDYTSFSRGDTLNRGRGDYTSFRIQADFDRDAWAILAATITYTDCSRNSDTYTSNTGLVVPVRA